MGSSGGGKQDKSVDAGMGGAFGLGVDYGYTPTAAQVAADISNAAGMTGGKEVRAGTAANAGIDPYAMGYYPPTPQQPATYPTQQQAMNTVADTIERNRISALQRERQAYMANEENFEPTTAQKAGLQVVSAIPAFLGQGVGGAIGTGAIRYGGPMAVRAYNRNAAERGFDDLSKYDPTRYDENGQRVVGTPAADPAAAMAAAQMQGTQQQPDSVRNTMIAPNDILGNGDISTALALAAMGINQGGGSPITAAPVAAPASAAAATNQAASLLGNNPYYQEQLGLIEDQFKAARDSILASGASGGNLNKQLRELEYTKRDAILELQSEIYKSERDIAQQTNLANLNADTSRYATDVSASTARAQLEAHQKAAEEAAEQAAMSQLFYGLGSSGGDK